MRRANRRGEKTQTSDSKSCPRVGWPLIVDRPVNDKRQLTLKLAGCWLLASQVKARFSFYLCIHICGLSCQMPYCSRPRVLACAQFYLSLSVRRIRLRERRRCRVANAVDVVPSLLLGHAFFFFSPVCHSLHLHTKRLCNVRVSRQTMGADIG